MSVVEDNSLKKEISLHFVPRYEGPVLNQIVKRRHAGTAALLGCFACQDVVMSLKLSSFSDGRHGWCCLTAHQSACLEKLVLRYPSFDGYRKNECQCVLSFQASMSLSVLDGTLSPERERSSSSSIAQAQPARSGQNKHHMRTH